jgi:perosamine synthetase
MFKAISRTHVDVRNSEIISYLFQLLNVNKATGTENLKEFEEAFAKYIGVKHAISFPSCRSGMLFTMKALELAEEDEVILPAYTFWIDAAMVILAGLKPVFVDVEFETHSIDPEKIEAAITPRTKVIFITHLNGFPAKMGAIMTIAKKHGLRVMEDSARSCAAISNGKRVGSFDIGNFSFGYGKSFYCYGGGMVTSDDDVFAEKLRAIKQDFVNKPVKDLYIQTLKGSLLKYLNLPYIYRLSLYQLVYGFQVDEKEKYGTRFKVKMAPIPEIPDSYTANMDNIQVSHGFKQLQRNDQLNAKRMENARILIDELKEVKEITLPPHSPDAQHLCVHFTIWTEHKKELQKYLTRHRIDSQDESATNTTLFEQFTPYAEGKSFPNTEKLHGNVLFLPAHPTLSREDMLYMAGKVKAFFAGM